MNASLTKKLLSVFLACALFSPFTTIHASESGDSLSITLEKTVQFEDPQGDEVLVAPGTYRVTAENNTLQLTSTESTTLIAIMADERSHTADIPLPGAASLPGGDGLLDDLHIVTLFLPNGKALQAIGTYPNIQSRGISESSESPATLTFEKAVHFMAPDGSPVVVTPGRYTAEAAQKWIRLIPGKERKDALLIEAQQATNDTEVEDLVAFSLPGSTNKELDQHYVMLLLPNGPSLEAVGSYSGIHQRDFFTNIFKDVRGQVRRRIVAEKRRIRAAAVRKAKVLTAQARKLDQQKRLRLLQIAQKAKQEAERRERLALEKAKQIEKIAQETARQADITACKVKVDLIRAGKGVAEFMQNLIPAGKQKNADAQRRFNNDKTFHDQLISSITNQLQAHKNKIPQLKHVATFMNQPQNKPKLDAIFSTDNFCRDSIANMDQKLIQAGMAPSFATTKTRGAQDKKFFLGYQVAFGIGAVAGLQVGLIGVTDFQGNGGKYWFIGPQAITNAAVGLTAEVAFYPSVPLSSFAGWGAGVGISAGPPTKIVSGAVDIMLDETVKHFQGFGFGPGIGLGVIPVDAAFSYTHSWKY